MENKKFKNKYRIESTRLKGWDYSSDAYYFITICEKNKNMVFGDIKNGFLCITPQGKIAIECWYELANHYHNCVLDKFVLMPNHLHGIIKIDNDKYASGFVETVFKPVSTDGANNKIKYSLSEMMRGFKIFSAKRINKL